MTPRVLHLGLGGRESLPGKDVGAITLGAACQDRGWSAWGPCGVDVYSLLVDCPDAVRLVRAVEGCLGLEDLVEAWTSFRFGQVWTAPTTAGPDLFLSGAVKLVVQALSSGLPTLADLMNRVVGDPPPRSNDRDEAEPTGALGVLSLVLRVGPAVGGTAEPAPTDSAAT